MTESSPLRTAKKSLVEENRDARLAKEKELKNLHPDSAQGHPSPQKFKLYLDPELDSEVNKAK